MSRHVSFGWFQRSFLIAGLACFGASSACTSAPAYKCTSNPQCVSESGAAGLCETSGLCSFFDAGCPTTLRRYPDGAGDLANQCVPPGKACISQIAAGSSHTCALRTDGTVWCWGLNADGEAGDGTKADNPLPTQVKGLPAGHKATQLGAGEVATCALLDDSTVWCWGANDSLQLGVCGDLDGSPAPLEVPTWTPNATDPANPTCNPGTQFLAKQIAVGGEHACALGTDGKVYCWGEDQTGTHGGQCGQDPTVFDDVPGPIPIDFDDAVGVQTGDEYSCALKDDNTVWCFGSNELDELGNGGGVDHFIPNNVSGLSDVRQLALGDELPCVQTKDGALWCWGNGTTGVFGNDLTDNVPKPQRITTCAQAFSGGAANTVYCAQGDGTLQCLGANDSGQCGIGNKNADVTTPSPVFLITVASGPNLGIGEDHACATTTDGALWCWGDNSHGQLGNGAITATQVDIPQRVTAWACP